jgi:tetrahydromethanopterin S-methyltransferase subunit A
MRGTLENLRTSLPVLKNKESKTLLKNVTTWFKQLEPLEYACFGCKYCIPPEAMTLLTSRYPSLASSTLSCSDFKTSTDSWPAVDGEYTVLDASAPVALTTLASVQLEGKLVRKNPSGLCIVGKTETENIGIDKIVKNVITNPAIQYIVLAGKDTEGHQSGKTLLALWENGVNGSMRVIGSEGRRPILKNVSLEEVRTFRQRVRVENMIGCVNTQTLIRKIKELAEKALTPVTAIGIMPIAATAECGCSTSCCEQPPKTSSPPRVTAKKFRKSSIKLDRAGYFVIIPSKKNKIISVEHYSYDNKLLRTIEGKKSRDIYLTIITNRWVEDLGHAAYIGKELARAELSLQKGFSFVQDGA